MLMLYVILLLFLSLFFLQNHCATIFIHGSLPPVFSKIVYQGECPLGISCAKDQDKKHIIGKIGVVLSQTDNSKFPLDDFYLFGWSGKLSFDERKKAAFNLYQEIKKRFNEEINIIGHSHGCNVALNLVHAAVHHQDSNLKIKKLILLAPPVQEVTKNLVKSDIFEKIFSFYSSSDLSQIIDPQGLYGISYRHSKNVPFFSQRIFPKDPKMSQFRILINNKDLWHIDFISEKFLQFLPPILNKVNNNDFFSCSGQIDISNAEKINILKSPKK